MKVPGEDALGLLPPLHARQHPAGVPYGGGVGLPVVLVGINEQAPAPRLVGDALQNLVEVAFGAPPHPQLPEQGADDLPPRNRLVV